MAVDVGSAVGYLDLDISGFLAGLKTAQNEAASATKNMATKVGGGLKTVGNKMTTAGKTFTKNITLPIVGLGTLAIKTSTEFESAMSKVSAISGATGNDLDMLNKKAQEMGAKTKFSAIESAEAFTYMAMAGWKTEDMLEGISGIMSLAAADGLDLATTSDIVTDALTAFGLEAKDSGHFADVLARASSSANTNVRLLGESFKYVAPVAGALGMSAEDVGIALGLMGNAGIKGSQAGTALRTSLTRLIKPTDTATGLMKQYNLSMTNSEGTMKSLGEVMNMLRKNLGGLTEAEQAQVAATIFGQDAMSGMLSIINASEKDYNSLTKSIYNAEGAAQQMADTMLDNLSGQLVLLKSALEGLAIQFGEILMPYIKRFTEWLQNLTTKFQEMTPEQKNQVVRFAAIAAAIGPVLFIIGKLITSIGGLLITFGKIPIMLTKLKSGFIIIGTAIGGITAPIAAVIAGIAALTVGTIVLVKHLKKDSIPAIELFGDGISEATEKAVGGFLKLNDKATLSLKALSWSGQTVTEEMAGNIVGNFSQMSKQIQTVLDEQHTESLSKMQTFLANSESLSKEEQETTLNNMTEGYEKKRQAVIDGEARIKEIMDLASAEKRALTKSEQSEINEIQTAMVETGIKVLSDSEVESKLIMERMKDQAGEMSALQAAEVVKNSLEQKEGAVKAAEEQYDEVMREIIRQRDEAGTISEEQAQKLIDEAKRQKDEVINNAEEMHNDVITEAKAQAGEHVDEVDWTTGEIKSKWEMLKENTVKTFDEIGESISNTWNKVKDFFVNTWNSIATFFTNIATTISTAVSNFVTSVITFFKELPMKIKQFIADAWSSVVEWATNMVNKAREMGTNFLDAVVEFFTQLPGKIWDWLMEAIAEVKQWVIDMGTNGTEAIESLIGNVVDGAKEIPEKMLQIGEDIVNGIWSGIQSLAGWFSDQVGGFFDGIVSGVKKGLGISSPSKVFADQIGKWLPPGIAKGFRSALPEATKDIEDSLNDGIDSIRPNDIDINAKASVTSFASKFKDVYTDVVVWFESIEARINNSIDRMTESLAQLIQFGQMIVNPDGSLGYIGYNGFGPGQRYVDPENRKPNPDNPGGDTFNFYSPKPIDEIEAARQLKKTKRDLSEGF